MTARKSPQDKAHNREAIPAFRRPEFLSKLRAYLPRRPWQYDPVKTIQFIYFTGCAPWVIVHPRESQIRVEDTDEGPRIRFNRHKPSEAKQRHATLAIAPALDPWVRDWVRSLPDPIPHRFYDQSYRVHEIPNDRRSPIVTRTRRQDFCYEVVADMVDQVLSEIGFGGYTSRSLRHTMANWAKVDSGGDISAVARTIATTERNALRYSETNPEDLRTNESLAKRTV